jgi:hypothetical protein
MIEPNPKVTKVEVMMKLLQSVNSRTLKTSNVKQPMAVPISRLLRFHMGCEKRMRSASEAMVLVDITMA